MQHSDTQLWEGEKSCPVYIKWMQNAYKSALKEEESTENYHNDAVVGKAQEDSLLVVQAGIKMVLSL